MSRVFDARTVVTAMPGYWLPFLVVVQDDHVRVGDTRIDGDLFVWVCTATELSNPSRLWRMAEFRLVHAGLTQEQLEDRANAAKWHVLRHMSRPGGSLELFLAVRLKQIHIPLMDPEKMLVLADLLEEHDRLPTAELIRDVYESRFYNGTSSCVPYPMGRGVKYSPPP